MKKIAYSNIPGWRKERKGIEGGKKSREFTGLVLKWSMKFVIRNEIKDIRFYMVVLLALHN